MNTRYTLHRSWIGTGGIVNFVMLNPSTATDTKDDPTIRKCIGFAKRWGFAGLVVTNLFATRATDPADLRTVNPARAIGADNDFILIREARLARAVVCAWGDHGRWLGRDFQVCRLLSEFDLLCIGQTRAGAPLHPSRTAYTDHPKVFREKRANA